MKHSLKIALLITTICLWQNVVCQQPIRILFLLDASLSMRNKWTDNTKWQTAVDALSMVADSISCVENVQFGLRVFGHLYPEPDKNCKDTRLEVAIDSNNVTRFKRKLNEIRPKGITPIFYSIEKCASDFGNVQARNILILITDGEEACDGDPCAASFMLQKNNVILRPFVIGMALHPTSVEKLDCMGKLFNAKTSDEFANHLYKTVFEAIAKTTLQINLNDIAGKPTETNVNMTFYDAETGLAKFNFYHSLNSRGLPDTLVLPPDFTYNLQIHTRPPVFKQSIVLTKNRHNVINLNAPQGYLNFKLKNGESKGALDKISCVIHESGKTMILNAQKLNTTEKYLVGNYRLEILTIPRIMLDDVRIDQSKTTDVIIPTPGILTINKSTDMVGAIFMIEKGAMNKIYELSSGQKQEVVAIQPGKYLILYRSKNSRTIHTSVEKEIEITSGGSLSLRL
jgi:Ca-activated chloride channel family protein